MLAPASVLRRPRPRIAALAAATVVAAAAVLGSVAATPAAAMSPQQTTLAGTVNTLYWDLDAFWRRVFPNNPNYRTPTIGYYNASSNLSQCGGTLYDYTIMAYCPYGSEPQIWIHVGVNQSKVTGIGDYAAGVFLAHESGHHIANMLRLSFLTNSNRGRDLYADCLAGHLHEVRVERHPPPRLERLLGGAQVVRRPFPERGRFQRLPDEGRPQGMVRVRIQPVQPRVLRAGDTGAVEKAVIERAQGPASAGLLCVMSCQPEATTTRAPFASYSAAASFQALRGVGSRRPRRRIDLRLRHERVPVDHQEVRVCRPADRLGREPVRLVDLAAPCKMTSPDRAPRDLRGRVVGGRGLFADPRQLLGLGVLPCASTASASSAARDERIPVSPIASNASYPNRSSRSAAAGSPASNSIGPETVVDPAIPTRVPELLEDAPSASVQLARLVVVPLERREAAQVAEHVPLDDGMRRLEQAKLLATLTRLHHGCRPVEECVREHDAS